MVPTGLFPHMSAPSAVVVSVLALYELPHHWDLLWSRWRVRFSPRRNGYFPVGSRRIVLARRTRARLQVVANAVWLLVLVVVARRQSDLDSRRPTALPLGAGVVYAVLYHATHDYDVAGIQRSRLRRVAFVVVINVVRVWLRPQAVADRYGFALGQCLGTVAYRLRYGVLGGFPK